MHAMDQVTGSLRFRLPFLPGHCAGTASQHPKKELARNWQPTLPGQERKAQPASGSRTRDSRYQPQQSRITRCRRRGFVGRSHSSLHTHTLHLGLMLDRCSLLLLASGRKNRALFGHRASRTLQVCASAFLQAMTHVTSLCPQSSVPPGEITSKRFQIAWNKSRSAGVYDCSRKFAGIISCKFLRGYRSFFGS